MNDHVASVPDDEDQNRTAPREFHKVAKDLGGVVSGEASRAFTESQLQPDPALVAAGWERRFVTDAKRAREALDLYAALGFEVLAEPLRPADAGEGCDECFLLTALQFQTIYTRKSKTEAE